MLTVHEFDRLLRSRGPLIVDGALATELETRGYDLNHSLWSAKILREDPGAIAKIHLDYYLAGANIAITASYQASTQGLQDHFKLSIEDAQNTIETSARIAQKAREKAYKHVDSNRRLLVAGSVGPYGAYLADGSEYRGDYQRTASEFQEFHRPRIQALIEAGVDLLAIETMPQLAEVEAVLQLLRTEFPDAICWISCTLKDSAHLSDGTPLYTLATAVEQHRKRVVALGLNCVPTDVVADALQTLNNVTQLPLVCYPNSGEIWDANTKMWSGCSPAGESNEQQIQLWQGLGARLIGGCCRTGPNYIEMVRKVVERD